MANSSPRVELLLDGKVSDEIERQLVATFNRVGFATECRRKLADRDAAELSWLVLAALPIHAFLSGLSSEAAKDVYASVKALTRRKGKGGAHDSDRRIPLVLQDSDSGLRIVLEEDLPIEAYQLLIGLDLAAYQVGPLHYDRYRGVWRSELDEADG